MGNEFSIETRRLINIIKHDVKHVKFRHNPTITTYYHYDDATMLTYNSGADGNYIREKDRRNVGLPILRVSNKKVGVANGDRCKSK